MVLGRFADQDSYVLSQLLLTAQNNAADLNVTVQESDYLHASSVAFQAQGLTGTLANPVPNVTLAGQQTLGAAIGGIDQPGGGGCFDFFTPVLMANGLEKNIGDVVVGKDWVKAFDNRGNLINALCIGKWEHWVQEMLQVEFYDGRVTNTRLEHRYWIENDLFVPVSVIENVRHWAGEWTNVAVKSKQVIVEPLLMYNLQIDVYQTYLANGDAVHNVKAVSGNES